MRVDEHGRIVPCVEGPRGKEAGPGYIVLTDPPPLPTDERCHDCDAGYAARIIAPTYGRAHDMCSVCGFHFAELTVSEQVEETEMT